MKIGAIIEARMTSSRLPGKHLKRIGHKFPIQILLEQLSFCRSIDQVVVACTVNKEDDILAQVARNLGASVYRGNEDNVYERVVGAALTNQIDLIVEVTGDCPLIDPEIVDAAVTYFLDGEYDYVSNAYFRHFPDGMDVQVFSTSTLRASQQYCSSEEYFEHVTMQFRELQNGYNIFNLPEPGYGDYGYLSVTLDTFEDLVNLEKIYRALKTPSTPIKCSQIIDFLIKNESIEI